MAKSVPTFLDLKKRGLPRRLRYEQVDEAGAGDLVFCQQTTAVTKMPDDDLGHLARRFTLALGYLHGDVAGEITMFRIGGMADDNGWQRGCRQFLRRAGFDQCRFKQGGYSVSHHFMGCSFFSCGNW